MKKIRSTPNQLRIPYAVYPDGQIVHIDTVGRGKSECVCPACGERLTARKGDVRIHHFSHQSGHSQCRGESQLHALGKLLLSQRINKGLPLVIVADCPNEFENYAVGPHKEVVEATPAHCQAKVEQTLPNSSIRPDVTILKDGSIQLCCEIVVTHSPDYEPVKMPIPILSFQVESARDLHLIASDDPIPCRKYWNFEFPCLKGEEYRATVKGHRPIKLQAWKMLERMRRQEKPTGPLRSWSRDTYHPIHPGTARRLEALGQELLRRGFVQHNRNKPWVFRYGTPLGDIYANLGSTDIIPIWESMEPFINALWRPRVARDEMEALLRNAMLQVAFHVLKNSPCGVRQTFYDHRVYDIKAPLMAEWGNLDDDLY